MNHWSRKASPKHMSWNFLDTYLRPYIFLPSTSTHTQHATPCHKPCQARRGRQSSATYVTQMYKRVWVVEFNFAVKGRLLMHLLQVSCDLTGMEPMSFVEHLFQSLAMHVLKICAYPTFMSDARGRDVFCALLGNGSGTQQARREIVSIGIRGKLSIILSDHPKNPVPRGPK